eukprot:793388-Rhodomonas_salina.1
MSAHKNRLHLVAAYAISVPGSTTQCGIQASPGINCTKTVVKQHGDCGQTARRHWSNAGNDATSGHAHHAHTLTTVSVQDSGQSAQRQRFKCAETAVKVGGENGQSARETVVKCLRAL